MKIKTRKIKGNTESLFETAIFKALKRRKVNLSDKDAPEITEWKKVVVGKYYRPIKKQITVRIDADVLDWFKGAADKYQTLINQACREYMQHHDQQVARDKHS